jgi:hypothetical protein
MQDVGERFKLCIYSWRKCTFFRYLNGTFGELLHYLVKLVNRRTGLFSNHGPISFYVFWGIFKDIGQWPQSIQKIGVVHRPVVKFMATDRGLWFKGDHAWLPAYAATNKGTQYVRLNPFHAPTSNMPFSCFGLSHQHEKRGQCIAVMASPIV